VSVPLFQAAAPRWKSRVSAKVSEAFACRACPGEEQCFNEEEEMPHTRGAGGAAPTLARPTVPA
jgi:hypothetical protein